MLHALARSPGCKTIHARVGICTLLLVVFVGIASVMCFVQDGTMARAFAMPIDGRLQETDNVDSSTPIPNHVPISIKSDAQLDAFPDKTGSGTPQDPYVIRDLVIDGGGTESCLSISNTRHPLRIINCTAMRSSRVISAHNMMNGEPQEGTGTNSYGFSCVNASNVHFESYKKRDIGCCPVAIPNPILLARHFRVVHQRPISNVQQVFILRELWRVCLVLELHALHAKLGME
ncbi:MAG: hypothetical protein Q6353_020255 [Candidatus Sigynarchaeum springense]